MKDTDTLLFIYLVFNVVFKHTGGERRRMAAYRRSLRLPAPQTIAAGAKVGKRGYGRKRVPLLDGRRSSEP